MRTQVEEVISVQGRTARDGEIDEAESCLKNSDPQRAHILLERLKQRHWEELTPLQQYRVKAAFSNVAHVRGDEREAGRLLLEAKGLCPESERAQINEALGLELVGRKEEAHALSTRLREQYHTSGKLLAIQIRTSPASKSLEDMQAMVSPILEKDADVSMALAIRAMGHQRFSEAVYYARMAVAAGPDWFGSKFILGQALYNAESIKLGRNFRAGSDPLVQARLVEAIAAIDEAAALAKKNQANHLLSRCFLIRALANALRGQDDAADQDFSEATRTSPEDRHVHRRYAVYLFNRNRIDEAIGELRKAVRVGSAPVAESLLADLLAERDKPGDRAEAIEINVRLSLADDRVFAEDESESSPDDLKALRIAAFHSAITDSIDASRLDEAETFFNRASSGHFSDVSLLAAWSQLHLARDDFQGSVTAADDALKKVDSSTHELSIRALALQLGRLEKHKDALPLWQRITRNTAYGNDVRHLVRCAERVQQYDIILNVARDAREGGIQDTWLLFKEAEVLGMFDLDGAVALLRSHLKNNPDDRDARLRLSHLGLKWHRPDLIDARPDALPTLDEVTATGGAIAVEILRLRGDPNAALNYAYELVRRHFDHPDANAALIMVFFSPASQVLEIKEPSQAGPGVAVCYTEDGGRDRWVVIEDSPNPRPELNEYSPIHPLAKSFEGKCVGESVVLSKTSARDRTATIKEIKSKYLYRLHEIMESWQVRFPDQPFIQLFRVLSKDERTGQEIPDLTDMKMVADLRYERIHDAEKIYRTQLIPLHLLAEIVGADPFQVLYHVVLQPDLPVRCTQGREDEHDLALEALASCNTLVLDLTAIGSISLLESAGLLARWRGKLVISQSTAHELRSALENVTTKRQGSGHFGRTGQGYYFERYSEETMKAEADALATLVRSVLSVCEVRGCPDLASLDPVMRDQLISGFGQHGVESMLLARQPGHVLWSDDLAVAFIGSNEFSVRRVWTQVVVEHAVKQGFVDPEEYLVVSAKLMALDYQATTFNPFVLAKAGSLSKWDPVKWPLNKVLERFVNATMSPDLILVLAASMLLAVYKEAPLPETRQAVLIKIMERLLILPHGIVIAKIFTTFFPRFFGVNALGAAEASAIGHAWLAEARRRPRLELARRLSWDQ
ncbi:tetratricopeptide repeat protein [Singulisphaera sp. PoT]|uniref:tetratricopeptide repeat protein n=1 Tax=Singulisphaera sp. PoT TaxID=3411797 RepID=UPI003BF555D0